MLFGVRALFAVKVPRGVPINVVLCCNSTVVYYIENQLSERAVQSEYIIRCQGSIAISDPINIDICCSELVHSSLSRYHCNRCCHKC